MTLIIARKYKKFHATQQTWSGFSPTIVPDNNRRSGLSPTMVPKLSTGKIIKSHQNCHQGHITKCLKKSFNLTFDISWHMVTFHDILYSFQLARNWKAENKLNHALVLYKSGISAQCTNWNKYSMVIFQGHAVTFNHDMSWHVMTNHEILHLIL